MRALWEEFEERQRAEARFVRALDRLQPLLLNLAAGGGTWTENNITAVQELAKVSLIDDGSAELGACARDIVGTAVQQGILLPGSSLA